MGKGVTVILTDHDALLRACAATPDDLAPWLAYADWLDEHGEPEAAESAREQRVIVGEVETRASWWLERSGIRGVCAAYPLIQYATQLKAAHWRDLWRLVWRHRRQGPPPNVLARARHVLSVVFGEKVRAAGRGA